MVRGFCNGAVALGIALTACAAFPRAVMAIDLSRFYGHFNTKRSGKSTTGSSARRDRGTARKLASAPLRRHDSELLRDRESCNWARNRKTIARKKSHKNKIARSFYKGHYSKALFRKILSFAHECNCKNITILMELSSPMIL